MPARILIAVAVLLSAVAAAALLRPPQFRVERSILIAAGAERPFAYVNDLHAFRAWSPFESPDLRRSYSGPRSGVGASYTFSGDKAGAGTMTIVRSDAPATVVLRLDFERPMKASHVATFTFAPVPGGTRVTWRLDGTNNFVCRVVSLFLDPEKMVGREFERGLAALQRVSESAPLVTAEAR